MEKYKLCPGCGYHNNPLAIECEECGEDLSSVRILDAQTEEQLNSQTENEPQANNKQVKMVRICEECGTKNEPQSRKCINCGEDIFMILPTPDDETEHQPSLASTDGEFTFAVPVDGMHVIIGRENEMQDYLKNKLYVSRRHAEIFVSDGQMYITGFSNTANGTFVNGIEIRPDETIMLNSGDILGLGGNDPIVQREAAYFQVM